MSARSQARRLRRAEEHRRRTQAALARPCPTCRAPAGVWCFTRHLLGPDLHERRWGLVR